MVIGYKMRGYSCNAYSQV